MDRFFEAQSVAVVGVSNSPTNLGRAMVYNLMEFSYQGYIYVVGPTGGAFLGHKIYPSIQDLPEPVDVAAVLVPAPAVPDILEQCGEKGIRRVVVESGGFRELGRDRLHLEEKVLDILKRYGMRMIGPNCIGIISRHNGLAVPFMPMKAEAPPGRVAVVSQSGGVGAMMINSLAAENFGFSRFASIGNKLDVNETDVIEYFVGDEKTELILGYLEGISDGRRLMEIGFRSQKPILISKSNRGRSGAVIAQSHSASLSTDDQVVDAALEQCGIIRTYEQHQTMEKLKALMLPPMKGSRLAIISRSGGHAVMAADAAEEFGFELPPYPPELIQLAQEQSRAKVVQFHNPMDLGDLFNLPLYKALAEQTLGREDIDGLVFIHNYQGVFDAESSRHLITRLSELPAKFHKPLALCIFTMQAELELNRKNATLPLFTDPREAVRALALNRDYRERKPLPFSTRRPSGVHAHTVQSELENLPPGPVPPHTLARILAAYGIPLQPWRHAESEESAVVAAHELGFPVAVKTAHPEVIHKSDAGGVHLNVSDESALRSVYRKLLNLGPSVLIQKMANSGLEWLVGGRRDQHFGPVVVAGLGGIYVEIFKESRIRIAPVDHEEAARLVHEVKGSALLDGVRGDPPLDRQALLEVIVRLSWLLNDFPHIKEIDMNPIRVFPQGCCALDWRATRGEP